LEKENNPMYNGAITVLPPTGPVLAATGFDGLAWVVAAVTIIAVGLVLVRWAAVERTA